MNATTALSVENLGVSYGGIRAVSGVRFDVAPARCVGVFGANGAGKTSILRAIGGLVPAREGTRVRLAGERIDGLDAARKARAGLAHVLEGRHVFPALSVRENLVLGMSARRDVESDPHGPMGEMLQILPELTSQLDKAAGSLSGGQQQMLAIGRALIAEPTVVMMDEPTNGLAPMLVDRVIEIVNAVVRGGAAVLIVEQRLEVARAVCSEVHVLQRGAIISTTTGQDDVLEGVLYEAYLT